MSDEAGPRDEALEWLHLAQADLGVARFCLTDEDYHRNAVFHAQQAAEKALKGMCALKEAPIYKTHDLGEILEVVETFAAEFAERWADVDDISDYAVASRYPQRPFRYQVNADEAVRLAQELLEAVHVWMSQQSNAKPGMAHSPTPDTVPPEHAADTNGGAPRLDTEPPETDEEEQP